MFDIGLNKHLPSWCSIQVGPSAVLGTHPFITRRRMRDLPSQLLQPNQLNQPYTSGICTFVVLARKRGGFLCFFLVSFPLFFIWKIFAFLALIYLLVYLFIFRGVRFSNVKTKLKPNCSLRQWWACALASLSQLKAQLDYADRKFLKYEEFSLSYMRVYAQVIFCQEEGKFPSTQYSWGSQAKPL